MSHNRSSGGLNPPLKPRKGSLLKVVGVARISGHNQDEKSLDDQEASYRNWLDRNHVGSYELTMIATRGKGEQLDREELGRLNVAIDGGAVDLVLTEDIGRIVRRVHAFLICEDCEDAGVRLIAINDNIDTFKSSWRVSTFFASLRHELSNEDTSERIKRTQQNRFKQGGMIRPPLFCYAKAAGAKSDAELQKTSEMVPIVEGMVSRLEAGDSFTAVADWLNENKIPLGPSSRAAKWTGAQVRNVIYNPLLKGVRVRNRMVAVRLNKTGRRRSVRAAPEDLLEREVPHLAFIDSIRYDKLIKKLTARGEAYSVPKRRGEDPRKGRVKKRTRFPGQLAKCGICNRPMVFGGHGRKTHLMCSGARSHACWNGTTFDAGLASTKVLEAFFALLEQMPDFDSLLRGMIAEEIAELTMERTANRSRLEQDRDRNSREIENVLQTIRARGAMSFLDGELERLDAERNRIADELAELTGTVEPRVDLPSMDVIRADARKSLKELAAESYEFAKAMTRLITKFVVFPVRLCDGGHVELRAKIVFSLAPFLPSGSRVPVIEQHVTREITVDLFEPPQRAKHLKDVIAMRAELTEREVAAKLGLTITATQRAAELHRAMTSLGLGDMYVEVTEPPADLTKMRRHLHPRYKFDPLPPDEVA